MNERALWAVRVAYDDWLQYGDRDARRMARRLVYVITGVTFRPVYHRAQPATTALEV
jgi:hypothetical protein